MNNTAVSADIHQKFDAAINVIKCLPKNGPYQPSNDMMLKFYGLYKQATEGPCKDPKPAFYDMVRSYKWKAWNSLGTMHKEEAMETYVTELKSIVETMRYTDDVADFIETLGPFYEYVEVLNDKNEDNNHNVSKGTIKNDDRENSMLQCNGTEFVKVNGDSHLSKYDKSPDDDDQENLVSCIENHSSQSDFSPSLVNSFIQNDYEEISSTAESVAMAKKFISDTDTEDEYSEPAEFIEVVKENYSNSSTDVKVVTCGGGDASQASRVRLPRYQQVEKSDGFAGRQPSSGERASRPNMSNGNGGRRHRDSGQANSSSGIEVNAQLILILQKIHQDLQAVVLRLDSLESQAFNQHADLCTLCQRRVGRTFPTTAERSWWPFPELSPRSTFFLLTWPFVLKGAVKLLIFLRSRRKRK